MPLASSLYDALLPAGTMGAFFGAALLLGIAPGPDNIFVLTQSALYGARAGIASTLGLMTGLVWHTLIVALGVAAIFQTSPAAFTALKLVGAAYLVYLAWLTWKSGSVRAPAQGPSAASAGPGQWALYRRGVLMNATNPKVTLFFLAFLPQFTKPELGMLPWQTAQLGLLFALSTLLVFGGVALVGGRLSLWLNNTPRGQLCINRLAALVFVLLAASLLFGGVG